MAQSGCVAAVLVIVLVAGAGCEDNGAAGDPTLSPINVPPANTSLLDGVESWAYQLQSIDLDTLAASDYDLLVIDYADDGGHPFSAEQIAALQASDKLVLSYLSIGEAETYRLYWQSEWVEGEGCRAALSPAAPGWLGPVNPEWCGNYSVQFWDPGWQAVVLAYLDAIVAAGFDGVYLDKVDIFAYWMDADYGDAPFENERAALQMAAWVAALSEYARENNPEFVVVPQNGAEIVAYLGEDQFIEYVSAIDAIAVEDTFFCPVSWRESGNNPPYNPQEELLDLLDAYHAAGFPVLAVDYVTQPGKIRRFVEESQAHGFVPYTTTRALDELTSAHGN